MPSHKLSFEDLVIKDVKSPAKQDELDVLLDDIDGWLIELNSFKRDIELQITAQKGRIRQFKNDARLSKKELNSELAREEERRLKLIRLTVSIERKIHDVKKIRAEEYA